MVTSPFINSGVGMGSGEQLNLASDVTLNSVLWLRAAAAGNVVLRYPASSADVTVPAQQGEYIPVGHGVIVRSTTAVTVIAFGV